MMYSKTTSLRNSSVLITSCAAVVAAACIIIFSNVAVTPTLAFSSSQIIIRSSRTLSTTTTTTTTLFDISYSANNGGGGGSSESSVPLPKGFTFDEDYYDDDGLWVDPPIVRTENITIGKGELKNTGTSQYAATIIIMPSMRFNTSYNKAFQVSLAGVISVDFRNNIQTFPVPMVSWLRSF